MKLSFHMYRCKRACIYIASRYCFSNSALLCLL